MSVLIKKFSRYFILGLCFWLPRERQIRLERRLRGREEFRKLQLADCVIVSFGKSGRTWLRVLLSRAYQVMYGLAENQLIGFDNLHRRNAAIPRLFFTHDNYLKDYTGNADSKRDYYASKVILLARNPLDTTVSQYFQWKFRMRPGKKSLNKYPGHGDQVDIFPFMMDRDAGLPKVIDYLNLWANEAPKCREFLLVRYEDMRADTAGTLKRILEFIGTPATPEQIDEAVRFASVENMRQMEEKRTFWLSGSRLVAKDKSNPDSFKVRKAKVGGFRDYFDEAQLAELQALVARDLSPFYDFRNGTGHAANAAAAGKQA
jgi:Sulfotransferase domain